MYIKYDSADSTTSPIPKADTLPPRKSASSSIPQKDTAIAAVARQPIGALKNTPIIKAVKTGYKKSIAEAIPAGISLKLS